jgi:hypothetical protein
MEKRTDRLTAVYVDLAINVVGSHGLAAGVRALLECGTSSAVIERVLFNNGPRRGGNGISPK